MFQLSNKVALITGANHGMGKTHAEMLAQQGASVVLTDLKVDECENTAESIRTKGGNAISYQLDVASQANVEQVFDQVINHFGRLDILVNNAGIYFPKMALDLTEAEWIKMLDINLKGQFFCAQRAAKEMQKNSWGRIINIASIASGQVGVGIMGGAHYTASKGGIIGMTETLAIEWAPYGINVNAIAPGAIDTPMLRDAGFNEAALEELLKRIPLKRVGKPEEVSAMVVFLASEEASYVTGATFAVDGGWLAV